MAPPSGRRPSVSLSLAIDSAGLPSRTVGLCARSEPAQATRIRAAARSVDVIGVSSATSGVSIRSYYRAAPLSRPTGRGRTPVVTGTDSVDTVHQSTASAARWQYTEQR